jgi:hypothetical protein
MGQPRARDSRRAALRSRRGSLQHASDLALRAGRRLDAHGPPPLVTHGIVGHEAGISVYAGDVYAENKVTGELYRSSPITPITDTGPHAGMPVPGRDDIIAALAESYDLEHATALNWLSQYDWRAALAEAA